MGDLDRVRSVSRGRSAVRLAAALAIVLVTALGLLLAGRWLDTVPTIAPESDLATPAVFTEDDPLAGKVATQAAAGVPILCYHYFRPGLTPGRFLRVLGAVLLNMPTIPDKEYWTTTAPEFDRQMRYLWERGYRTLRLDEVADLLARGRRIPDRCVVITIDDGDRSFVEHAVPVLRRYGFHATVFLLTGFAGVEGWNDLDLVDWETLRALEAEGVIRVESHTHRMHSKVQRDGDWMPLHVADASVVRQDLETSRAAIRRYLGHDSRFLAWPFGYGDGITNSLAHAAGMRCVLTLRPERVVAAPPPHQGDLGRFAVTARTSFRMFRTMVRPIGEGESS